MTTPAGPPPSGERLPVPPVPGRPPPETPVAFEPDDFPHPLRAHDVPALLPKLIG